MRVCILRSLTYHLKVIPYRAFLTRRKKILEIVISQQEAKNAVEDALAEAENICFVPEKSFMNDGSDEELKDWLAALGVLVQKWF